MAVLRLLLTALALGLGSLIWLAVGDGSFSIAAAWLTSQLWGLVTLVDLYSGFIVLALIIWWFEPARGTALLWIIPLPILGNLWTLVWFIWRLPLIRERLSAR
ncbi:hypothetical protein [Pseudohoeflea coraliihabitans]|uniref:DUF1475 domain-containing protein n=1 Tax=Pseudohoeflea coraliihabitans TaxID=2860393 RepID=A0ABS6WNB3_9HYPH|nr:hypothetical protein [Pseudohoeflea sp. DP4N28-3]MBW3097446.1 hypothetical protein [Pseudohoeflea sp. DP4N28-3]